MDVTEPPFSSPPLLVCGEGGKNKSVGVSSWTEERAAFAASSKQAGRQASRQAAVGRQCAVCYIQSHSPTMAASPSGVCHRFAAWLILHHIVTLHTRLSPFFSLLHHHPCSRRCIPSSCPSTRSTLAPNIHSPHPHTPPHTHTHTHTHTPSPTKAPPPPPPPFLPCHPSPLLLLSRLTPSPPPPWLPAITTPSHTQLLHSPKHTWPSWPRHSPTPRSLFLLERPLCNTQPPTTASSLNTRIKVGYNQTPFRLRLPLSARLALLYPRSPPLSRRRPRLFLVPS